jgi:hypothetical protein
MQQAEVFTQTDNIGVSVIDTSVITTYVDIATQTDIDAEVPQPKSEETTAKKDEGDIKRAPIASRRHKTFPLVKNKCRDDCRACSEPVITSSGSKFRKKSRVKWEGVDQIIQTDDLKPAGPKPEDETQDVAKSSSPSTEERLSSPKLCTKCANEAPRDPESDPEHSSRPGLCHTCTSRSSLTCQQCFPSTQAPATISPMHACPWNVPDQESRRSTIDVVSPRSAPCPEERVKPPTIDQPVQEVAKSDEVPDEIFMPIEIDVVYTDQPPIPDPMKRPSLPRLKLKQPQSPPERAQYSASSRSKSLPQAPQPPVVVNLPIQLPDVVSNSSLDTIVLKPGKITDKQVFKGLHVATAAACDEDVDKWIEEITGCGVRKFLADLSRFEGLGVNTLADVARRAARQRREKVRAWEVVREARVAQKEANAFSGGTGGNLGESCVDGGEQANWMVGEMGIMASDGVEEELVCRVVHAWDCQESEGDGRAGC